MTRRDNTVPSPAARPWTRAAGTAALASSQAWDVVVIGGGASGLGVAVDAASRGLRTLLVEGHDFAKGTSSRSTKLVHGGVRYLANGELGLVRSALRERARMLRNAPHVAHRQTFVLPADEPLHRLYYLVGLHLYDALACRLRLGSTRLLSRRKLLALAPTLRRDRNVGGVSYIDGQFDDARFAIALARTAVNLGATVLNYVRVIEITHAASRVTGVVLRDEETGTTHTVRACSVVNATGVFADAIRRMDAPEALPVLAASQGIHLVLPRRCMPGDVAVIWPKTEDGRVLFAVPWHGRVLLGTTDTPVERPALEPEALAAEVEYLLTHAARYLDPAPVRADVLSVFAGLRPLVRVLGYDAENAPVGRMAQVRTAAISRDHLVERSRTGMISLLGGKWTTYRQMAQDAVDMAVEAGNLSYAAPCVTANLRLHGAPLDAPRHANTAPPTPDYPLAIYGDDIKGIRELIATTTGMDALLHPALPYRAAEVVWAARHEAARSVEDVLARRTRALLLDATASVQAAPRVAALLAAELGRDEAWQRAEVEAFTAVAAHYRLQ